MLCNIGPLGLTYATLNRRLLGLTFVINRVAVFTGVSIVVIGTFPLVEWGLSEWLSNAGHTTNRISLIQESLSDIGERLKRLEPQ